MKPSEIQRKIQVPEFLKRFPRGHAVLAGVLAVGLLSAMVGIPSGEETPNRKSLRLELPIAKGQVAVASTKESEGLNRDQLAKDPLVPASLRPEEYERSTFTIKPGDSLSTLFNRAGLTDRALYELMSETPEAGALRRIMPGRNITFEIDSEGRLHQLVYDQDRLSSLVFTREEGTFVAAEERREADVQIAYRRATIDTSLFLAGQKAGMTDTLIMELAGIFGWDIDFILDIRRGDTFSVLYEERFLEGEKIGHGAILAAEFTNQGKTYQAVRYVDSNGKADFYTPEGLSMRREFLRTPVDFTRISSPFNPNRRHPVLNTIRAHKGTDYAAPTGTPIKAAGDGRIVHAGRKGGYGNTVIIQHNRTYRTLYAHMHRVHRNIRVGSTVSQGQTIGYVGASGLATGPHLHYEFYVNGSVRDPVTVELPQADPIPESELARFKTHTQPIIAQLEQYHQTIRLAVDRSGNDKQGLQSDG